jgi:hypothetical protein
VNGCEYIEEITDPVTGEVVTLRAATEAELDAAVAERFGIDREDRENRIPRSPSAYDLKGGDASRQTPALGRRTDGQGQAMPS